MKDARSTHSSALRPRVSANTFVCVIRLNLYQIGSGIFLIFFPFFRQVVSFGTRNHNL